MGHSLLQIKVQSIGIIDAVLTASIMAALVFHGVVSLWQKPPETYESTVRFTNFQPDLKEFLQSLGLDEGNDSNNQSGAGKILIKLTFNSGPPEEHAYSRSNQFWLWLFHDVAIGAGLTTILVAALALVRSTSLAIAPKRAIVLVRVWLVANILVVAIIAMSFASMMMLSNKLSPVVESFLGWAMLYLTVRTLCTMIVWNYFQELASQTPSLITDANADKIKEEA